jgi:hypothetical protein
MTDVYSSARGVTAAVMDNENQTERRRGVKSDAVFITWLWEDLNGG